MHIMDDELYEFMFRAFSYNYYIKLTDGTTPLFFRKKLFTNQSLFLFKFKFINFM